MKLLLFKLKKGKEGKWLAWCLLLMTDHKEEAIKTLEEENVLFEGGALLELDGKKYVVGMTNGDAKPTNMNRELNKKHKEVVKDCLEYIKDLEINYQLYMHSKIQ